MGFKKEFKEFAVKGNMVDMAIGIIIGAGFSAIVKSLVDHIMMPITGLFTGGIDFSKKQYILKEAVLAEDGTVLKQELVIKYGQFVQTSIDFLIVALCLFVVIKIINRVKRTGEDPKDTTIPTPANILLLTEIRDALVKQRDS